MLRNVDESAAKADLFKRDDNIVSLMGAYLPKRDKHYQDSAYNSQYNAAYRPVLNLATRYKNFGRTPEEINSYNRHVVTDIPKAIANVGISAYESAANLANGSAFPEDPAYAHIGRIGYGIPKYGNALETAGSLGLGAYTLGRGVVLSKETPQATTRVKNSQPLSVVDGEYINNPTTTLPARTRTTSKGVSIEYVPQGTLLNAQQDFAAFKAVNIRTTSDGKVIMGNLKNGNVVKLRPSNDGGRNRWTIEVIRPNGRTIREIRYGNQ